MPARSTGASVPGLPAGRSRRGVGEVPRVRMRAKATRSSTPSLDAPPRPFRRAAPPHPKRVHDANAPTARHHPFEQAVDQRM